MASVTAKPFFTARVRSTYDGRLCCHRCVSVQLSGGGGVPCPRSGSWGVPHPRSGSWGVPHPRSGWWGGYPSQVWMVGGGTPARSGWWGVPHPRSGWWGVSGVPPHHDWMGYSSCYAVGGMPLTFTQEDFLVIYILSDK